MLTIPQAFQKFLTNLELTSHQRDDASRQHTYLRSELQGVLDVDDNFLSGSYARHTAVRPLNDIDVFLVLRGKYQTERPDAVLNRVRAALGTIYNGKTSTRQARSVNIEFTGTGIAYDVVPAFTVSVGVYAIPDVIAGGWIGTNPRVHQEASTKANEAAGKLLKPLFKAVKHAKNVHQANARSFHLEVMSWSVLSSPPRSYLEGLTRLFDGLAARVHEPCPDPAGLGPDIRASEPDRKQTKLWLDKMAGHARDARALAEVGRVSDAHDSLRELFGSSWPVR